MCKFAFSANRKADTWLACAGFLFAEIISKIIQMLLDSRFVLCHEVVL